MEEKRFDIEQTNEYGEKGYTEKKLWYVKWTDKQVHDIGEKYTKYQYYYKYDFDHTKKFVVNNTEIELFFSN